MQRRVKRKQIHKRLGVLPLMPIPSYRLKLTFLILIFGLLGLLSRAGWLQIIQGPVLEARARESQTRTSSPIGTRRLIVDRRGRLVALDEERFRLWAHPRYFQFLGDPSGYRRDNIEVARKLSTLLSKSTKELLLLLDKKNSGLKIADNLTSETTSKIEQLGISGLDLEAYSQRIYPQSELFANVVGFVNHDRIPQAGLELSFNKELLKQEQSRNFRFGGDGTILPNDLKTGVFDGDNSSLHLTLDSRLQVVAAKALRDQVREWQAKKGVAIVMDVTNGEILALASTPSFNPNKYWNFSPSLFREWSVQDLVEPGSTFKPINLALALEEGVIKPNGEVEDTGVINIGGWPLSNWDRKANGKINYPRVLQLSSNVGMVKIMRNLDSKKYWEWLHKLGIDSSPETDLPGAASGQLKSKEIFTTQPIEPAVASFGQGFSITPLKLAQLHALIANGGILVKPHITKGFPELASSEVISPRKTRLFKSEVSQMVLEWMETVVVKGSGKGIQTDGYRIAGKTGTAQKADDGKNYTSKTCSFVAIFPVDKPKYVALVVVDEPSKINAYGSTVAVPVAKKIIESLLVLERIPPSP